jgi:hypothetical protein
VSFESGESSTPSATGRGSSCFYLGLFTFLLHIFSDLWRLFALVFIRPSEWQNEKVQGV